MWKTWVFKLRRDYSKMAIRVRIYNLRETVSGQSWTSGLSTCCREGVKICGSSTTEKHPCLQWKIYTYEDWRSTSQNGIRMASCASDLRYPEGTLVHGTVLIPSDLSHQPAQSTSFSLQIASTDHNIQINACARPVSPLRTELESTPCSWIHQTLLMQLQGHSPPREFPKKKKREQSCP